MARNRSQAEIDDMVRQRLRYDPETGVLTWVGNLHDGQPAGNRNVRGYVVLDFHGMKLRAHRVAWFLAYGIWPEVIDHINGDPSDNRLVNLRSCRHADNARNKGLPSNNTSGFKGVHWHIGVRRWIAKLRVGDRRVHIGTFDTPEAAEAAYDARALQEFGEFARTNSAMHGAATVTAVSQRSIPISGGTL